MRFDRRTHRRVDDLSSRLDELCGLRAADQAAAKNDCDVRLRRHAVEGARVSLDLEPGFFEEAAELGLPGGDDEYARHRD
jgi:hypothetical protein